MEATGRFHMSTDPGLFIVFVSFQHDDFEKHIEIRERKANETKPFQVRTPHVVPIVRVAPVVQKNKDEHELSPGRNGHSRYKTMSDYIIKILKSDQLGTWPSTVLMMTYRYEHVHKNVRIEGSRTVDGLKFFDPIWPGPF